MAIDATTLNPGTKFCNKEGYDILLFQMIEVVKEPIENIQATLVVEEVSIEDISLAQSNSGKKLPESVDDLIEEEDWVVIESKVEKVRLLLRHQEVVNLLINDRKK